MPVRQQISMPLALKRRAQARAAQQRISLSEYLRRLIAQDLGPPELEHKPDISIFFDLIDDGPPTNIARDKDKMLGEAVWEEHLRKTGRRVPRKRG
jgi:hypothetical protein